MTAWCTWMGCVGGSGWRLYDYVARNFIASLMPPLRYKEHICTLRVGNSDLHTFTYTWHTIIDRGWTSVMPWRLSDLCLNTEMGELSFKSGDRAEICSAELIEGVTEPPPHLKEYELIDSMDKNGIGTDASISTHVKNICDRRYVTVCDNEGRPILADDHEEWSGGGNRQGRGARRGAGGDRGSNRRARGRGRSDRALNATNDDGYSAKRAGGTGRFMVPTPLGIALVQAFDRCDESLVRPELRASMEQQVAQIAAGQDRKDTVLERNLRVFHQKYENFVLPATFDRIVRPLFIDEAATQAIIDAAIDAKREYKSQLRTLNEGHMAKAEAKAEIGTQQP